MSNQPAPHDTSTPVSARRAWWRRTGEPMLLTALGILVFTLPLLALLGVLALDTAVRGVVALSWVAGGLLLLRLPRLLRHERHRVALLACVGIFAMLAALLVSVFPLPNNRAADTQAAELAVVLSALQQETLNGTTNSDQAAPQAQSGQLTFVSPPRISADMFAYVLQRGSGAGPSPAAPYAYELYNIVTAYGIDPAVALAFFAHESQFCRTGVCIMHNTKGWGAQRAAFRSSRAIGYAPGPFVRYASWQDSVRDWCELILYGYVRRGLDTVEKAVPVYAPSSDGNAPSSYINIVRRLVAGWQGRSGPIGAAPRRQPEPPRVYTDGLENALIAETFRSTGLEFHANWAFHRYALDEARAGRALGAPLDESRVITVNDKKFAVQTFALDTLYTPLADTISETNWNDVQRFSVLLKQNKTTPTPAPTTTTATPKPSSTATTPTAATATPKSSSTATATP